MKIVHLEALAKEAKMMPQFSRVTRKEWVMEFFLGTAVFIADIWAIVKTLQSPATPGTKALWVLVIFLLPVIGLVIWFFMGPRGARG
jgi:hypothetical protein